ncbi:MAG: hypothetical protein LBT03_00650 [Holosporales bacterium]|jgi:hypothetical protein|nr:hypothetical protein [Holosporales bacterium]
MGVNEFTEMMRHEIGHVKHKDQGIWQENDGVIRMMDAILNGNIQEFIDQLVPMFLPNRMEPCVRTILEMLNVQQIGATQAALIGCSDIGELMAAIAGLNGDQRVIAQFWHETTVAALESGIVSLLIPDDWRNLSSSEIRRRHPAELMTPLGVARLVYVMSTLFFRDVDQKLKSRILTIEEEITMNGRVPLLKWESQRTSLQRSRTGNQIPKNEISMVVDKENDYEQSTQLDAQFSRTLYHNPSQAGKLIPLSFFRLPKRWVSLARSIDSGCFDQPTSYYAQMLRPANWPAMFLDLLEGMGIEDAQLATCKRIAWRLRKNDIHDLAEQVLREIRQTKPLVA